MTLTTHATIWRVNNTAGVVADFTTIQTAHDAATAGDTIYVEASATNYSSFNVSKKVIIIGAGYDKAIYFPDTFGANLGVFISGITRFLAGSSGSQLIGVRVNSNNGTTLSISADNVQIIRCNLSYSGSGFAQSLSIGSANVIISECSIQGISFIAGTGIILRNNFITSISGVAFSINNAANAVWVNNIFSGSITLEDQTLYNNINRSALTLINCNLSNNIDARIGEEVFGTANGNFGNVTGTDVFEATGVGFEYYRLKTGSPAIGAGLTGEYCGIFGGDTPFVLGMIPPIPWVTKLFNPGAGSDTQPLNITISVQSNN